LVDGSRVSKAGFRLDAIGEVDEANCAVGLAIAALDATDPLAVALARLQNELFDLGADLATPDGIDGALRIVPSQVDRLEAEIDAWNAALPDLTSFILPGGDPAVAAIHLARAIVRRAERAAVNLAEAEPVNPHAMSYLNRLSDHLFVAARHLAAGRGGDVLWQPGATRG
jgi:cob(I)alamin adenosyltransferase